MSTSRTSGGVAGASPRHPPVPRPAPGGLPHLRLVPDADPARRRRALARTCTVLAVVLTAAGLFFVVFLHVLLTQGQADLDRLRARAEVEAAQNRRLRVAVAELESPDRIVGVARGRLGMVPPATVTYLQAVDASTPLPPVPPGPPPTTATTTPVPTTAATPTRAAATTATAPAPRPATPTTTPTRR